ncbi:high-affinity choline transporter 1-like [Latimeria chalumnae]|uniref:High affinity choline transporter 1 n=1 Tax=Latimeria chalumnae TaxID=7897 RepID=H2ZXY1_LATCH|nr:PREDICTED: high-affinity choline transporter 1-like isoform X2 [Latimeria chalumnae]|eukprot:XP_006013306.1 PREDICTED: high-affinity choline transporter 1-like isoform X2 [Latimeria chalumnae]
MALNIPGLIAIIVFYLIILATGVWASRKSKKEEQKCLADKSEVAMVGGRNMGFLVGLFTTTATWVGGSYVNGISEMVYSPSRGLAWAQAPIGYAISLILGGIFFVTPMRSKNYVTMIDPFQIKYGKTMGGLMVIPAVVSDIFWSAAILGTLGVTMTVILGISSFLSIILSASIAIIYTLFGGLYSVAYTDVIQLIFIVVSLWICIPFALKNPATTNIAYTAVNEVYQSPWIGKIEVKYLGRWIDDLLLLVLGGIPWQEYFQRVLAASSIKQAKLLSILSGICCFFMAIPSVIIGAAAVSTDWNQTSYGLPAPTNRSESSMILPIVLQYLCPIYVSIIGIGAISAAVMSSVDSAFLSGSSMFARNVYKNLLRKKASETEIIWVMRIMVISMGIVSSALAFYSDSIYGMWFLCGELVYAIIFPQLICVLFFPKANTYGSIVGFLCGFILRVLGGEPFLKIPPVIRYPGCTFKNGTHIQLFPFKTFTMLFALITIVAVSYLARYLFQSKVLPEHWDFCNIIPKPCDLSITTTPSVKPEDILFLTGEHVEMNQNKDTDASSAGKSEAEAK